MRKSRKPIIIASRRSRLARVQVEAMGAILGRLHASVEVQFVWIESEGDQITDRPLADAGGKGLFAGAVEQALLDRRADIAIHSLKDLPAHNTRGLTLAAIPKRADPRDCLVTHHDARSIDELPHSAVVGTASPRRGAQLIQLRSDLDIQLLRGNVDTRIRKVMEEHQVDATLMAMSGLQRSGLHQHTDRPVDPQVILPSAGQGALAVQCRIDDTVTMSRCLPLNEPVSAAAVHCERSIIADLHGDCHSPIAVYCEPVDVDARSFRLRARVLAPDGSDCAEAAADTTYNRLTQAGRQIVASLQDQGAEAMLKMPPPQRVPAS